MTRTEIKNFKDFKYLCKNIKVLAGTLADLRQANKLEASYGELCPDLAKLRNCLLDCSNDLFDEILHRLGFIK